MTHIKVTRNLNTFEDRKRLHFYPEHASDRLLCYTVRPPCASLSVCQYTDAFISRH